MGNPNPQPRTNASKPHLKPKHRLSGSVSNISFTSEDPKPKHRHSGSVSNISLSAEDLKPIHRRSGSFSSVSTTAEDVQSKHRRTGSASNTKNSEDFTSSSRDVSSPSLVPSSSVALKEKRLKRRTRSSLGGTEDFVKELDFLAPSPNGRTPDSTRQELLKPSQSTLSSDSAPLDAASDALASVPEASIGAHVEGIVEYPHVGQANNVVVEKIDVRDNGGSPHETSFGSAKGSVQPGDAVPLARSKSNGVARGNPSTVEMSRDEQFSIFNQAGGYQSPVERPLALENGHLPITATGIPLVGTSTEGSDCIELANARTLAEAVTESCVDEEPPSESLVSDAAATTTSEPEEFIKSGSSKPPVTDATLLSFANGDSKEVPSTGEVSQNQQGAQDMPEEKVSVQRRIEELEKIAGGRPVHFRSQSLSLPRQYDISHARHHEAEGSKGFKMPVYRAPLDGRSVSEVGSLELAETAQDEELSEESRQCDVMASKETDCAAGPTESSSQEGFESRKASKNEEGQLSSEAMRSSSDQAGPHVRPIMFEAVKVADLSPDSMVNGLHLENATNVGSLQSLSISKAENVEDSQTPKEIVGHAAILEHNLGETREEDGFESGLGEAYVMVSADSVSEEVLGVPKELHSGASRDLTEDHGAKFESAEAGVLVEPPPGAQKGGAVLETHPTDKLPEEVTTGTLPVTHERGTLPQIPSVSTPKAEQSSQDFETSILLPKQPAVDPLFIDSQQDRLWEMHSQELTIGESSGQEVRESSAQDDDPRQYANGTPTHAEVAPAGSTANGHSQSDKTSKVDRPRTPLRSLLAEEDAEKCSDSGPPATPPQNQSGSPRGNLFKRIVSGGKNSPTKQTTPSKFSPKNQTVAKPFLSSCMCCSVK